MLAKTIRKIVRIDEDKCDGCGACVAACAESAIQIIDGKARLISDKYCDGLGACLGECPRGAIGIEERDVEEFDEEAVKQHLAEMSHSEEELVCGCSSATVTQFQNQDITGAATLEQREQSSMLGHWPVQLTLVPPTAPFLQEADVVLAADCVPFAYAGFHQHFLKDHSLLVACPKLDDFQAHLKKMTEILHHSDVKSLTVIHMEVPCCSGLVHMVRQALRLSGKDIPVKVITIGIKGGVLTQSE